MMHVQCGWDRSDFENQKSSQANKAARHTSGEVKPGLRPAPDRKKIASFVGQRVHRRRAAPPTSDGSCSGPANFADRQRAPREDSRGQDALSRRALRISTKFRTCNFYASYGPTVRPLASIKGVLVVATIRIVIFDTIAISREILQVDAHCSVDRPAGRLVCAIKTEVDASRIRREGRTRGGFRAFARVDARRLDESCAELFQPRNRPVELRAACQPRRRRRERPATRTRSGTDRTAFHVRTTASPLDRVPARLGPFPLAKPNARSSAPTRARPSARLSAFGGIQRRTAIRRPPARLRLRVACRAGTADAHCQVGSTVEQEPPPQRI